MTKIIKRKRFLHTFAVSSLAVIIVISLFSGSVFFFFIQQQKREVDISSKFIFIQNYFLFRDPEDYFKGKINNKMRRKISYFFQYISDSPDIFNVVIYNRHYQVLWSNNHLLVGKVFPYNKALKKAYQGTSVFNSVKKKYSKQKDRSLLITSKEFIVGYLPVWDKEQRHVIGVVELYKTPKALFYSINEGHQLVFIVFLLSGLILFIFMYWIVSQADHLIETQKIRIKQAKRHSVELNEHHLRWLGSELHDGPAQSIGYALLKLDSIVEYNEERIDGIKKQNNIRLIAQIQIALSDALKEIRSLSAGLFIPDFNNLCVNQAIQKVITRHEKRTTTRVKQKIKQLPQSINMATKICIYRFIQEGLNNAFQHGKGIKQYIALDIKTSYIIVMIKDNGPGMKQTKNSQSSDTEHLGLRGLRERIENLSGIFHMNNNRIGTGVTLIAILPL